MSVAFSFQSRQEGLRLETIVRSIHVAGTVALLWLSNPAIAQKGEVEIGVLTCSLEEPDSAPSTSGAVTESQVRDAICTFKPRNGGEESYAGTVQGVSISLDRKATAIWVVKAGTAMPLVPGLLQQSYAIDNATPADQLAPMVGETNSRIVLHSMTDKHEGSVGATQKLPPTGYVIIGLQLKLKSTQS